jgi:hypothetical protein
LTIGFMKITPEVIAALKEHHPDVDLFKVRTPTSWGEDDIEGVVRRANKAEWKMAREFIASGDPVKKVQASKTLFDSCVLYPSGTQRDELVARLPGLVETWSGEISELSGILQGSRVEKL